MVETSAETADVDSVGEMQITETNSVILVRPTPPPAAAAAVLAAGDSTAPSTNESSSSAASSSVQPVVIVSTSQQNDKFKHNTSTITIIPELPDPANSLASNISQVYDQYLYHYCKIVYT